MNSIHSEHIRFLAYSCLFALFLKKSRTVPIDPEVIVVQEQTVKKGNNIAPVISQGLPNVPL